VGDQTLERRARATPPAVPDAVPARRLRTPSWRDPRLLVGVVLVLASVVLGSVVVGSADDTVPVWVAARTLTAGQRVGAGDVRVQRVRLGDAATRYLSASAPWPDQKVALRLVPEGELVAAGAVGAADQVDLRPVAVPVSADVAAGLVPGVLVDVWVASRDRSAGSEAYGAPQQVARGAQVSASSTQRSALGASTAASVRLLLDPTLVPQVISAVDNGARITLVPVPATLGGAGS
jgi:hypothetical protein